ncbi:MAG: glycosyltransferase family 4 protein [Pseudomonadota bacterium]
MRKILVLTTLYPNAASTNHGVFVENRLRAYRDKYHCDVRCVAPVPWFPFENDSFGKYADYARAPKSENRYDIPIIHPRFLAIPQLAMYTSPLFLFRAFQNAYSEFLKAGWEPDLLDAHYLYPDGVAATKLALETGKPIVLTARGSDATLLPNYAVPRRLIEKALTKANKVVCVANALRPPLAEMGADEKKLLTLRNGVDLQQFSAGDREVARAELGVAGDVVISVGHLIKRKGHDLVIAALKEFNGLTLLIVGDGPDDKALKKQVSACGLTDRVRFLGSVPHEQMAPIYQAADALVLASSREGWPNILLEALACGTPVIATDVGGSGEVINSPEAGLLVKERNSQSIASAIKSLLQNKPDRALTRAFAERYAWDETADAMHRVFRELDGRPE